MKFSLRCLLIWITVFSVITAIVVNVGKRAQRTNVLVSQLEKLNGTVGVNCDPISGPEEVAFSVPGLPPLVRDADIAVLAPYLACCTEIRYVGLTNTEITDVSVRHIADSCRNLRQIELSGTDVTADAIRSLKKCPNLTIVSVSTGALTLEGIRAIKDLASLKKLYVYGASDDDPRIERLRLEKPSLDIEAHKREHLFDL